MIAIVAGMYFYAQWRLRQIVHTIPAKLGVNIQQTADGFSISKSVEGRTQFTVSASKAVQFKEGARADLHNVKIVIYGKDASRFDRIAGDDFEFDPESGNVSAKGKVLIDLQANPEGPRRSDQFAPEPTRNPIHLETNGLVFNKNTGDASATGKVVFQTPQASGSAVGLEYIAKTGTMTLRSAVEMTVNRPQPIHLNADHGVITKQPHQVFLTDVHMTRTEQEARSDQATFFLRDDDTVDRILAEGDVESESLGQSPSQARMSGSNPSSSIASSTISSSNTSGSTNPSPRTRARSDRAEFFLTGSRSLLTKAILTGDVRLTSEGAQEQQAQNPKAEPSEATAGKATLYFINNSAGQQLLQTIHAEDGVRLTQKNSQRGAVAAATPQPPSSAISSSAIPAAGASTAASATPASGAARPAIAPKTTNQDVEMTAPVMDFIVKDGRLLESAETTGPPQIVITQPDANQKTVVTSAKFTATFTDKNRLDTLHGEPNAKIVSSLIDAGKAGSAKAQPQRVSTSRMLDVVFLPEGGVRSITQTGQFVYVGGAQKAWAQRGEYTTSDQLIVLTGSPRAVDGNMTTTAETLTMNRVTGDAIAEGNVKSTYSDLKAQPDGAMLASSDPIHVTSHSMTAHRSSGIAVYTGDAHLWQDANVVVAPTLEFDRDRRSLFAHGLSANGASPGETSATMGLGSNRAGQNSAPAQTLDQPVSTVLVQVDKAGKVTPINITSARLHYSDPERKALFDGGVTATEIDATMTAQRMTVFLLPRSQSKAGTNPATPGQVDRIIAEDQVVITQPTRHATGQHLLYTSADDKFVLTGGSSGTLPSIFDAERGKTTGDSLTFYRHDDRVLVEGREKSPAVTRTQVAR